MLLETEADCCSNPFFNIAERAVEKGVFSFKGLKQAYFISQQVSALFNVGYKRHVSACLNMQVLHGACCL